MDHPHSSGGPSVVNTLRPPETEHVSVQDLLLDGGQSAPRGQTIRRYPILRHIDAKPLCPTPFKEGRAIRPLGPDRLPLAVSSLCETKLCHFSNAVSTHAGNAKCKSKMAL